MSPYRLRLYLPRALDLVATLSIGYVVVIPQSRIGPVNERTIGFAFANLGFALANAAGVRRAEKHGAAHA